MSYVKLVETDPIDFNQIMETSKHGVLRRSAGMPVVIHIATQLMANKSLKVEEALEKAQKLINTYNEKYTKKKEKKVKPEVVEALGVNCMFSGDDI